MPSVKHSLESIAQFRIDDPERFRLDAVDLAGTGGIDVDKRDAKDLLDADLERLDDLQERL